MNSFILFLKKKLIYRIFSKYFSLIFNLNWQANCHFGSIWEIRRCFCENAKWWCFFPIWHPTIWSNYPYFPKLLNSFEDAKNNISHPNRALFFFFCLGFSMEMWLKFFFFLFFSGPVNVCSSWQDAKSQILRDPSSEQDTNLRSVGQKEISRTA